MDIKELNKEIKRQHQYCCYLQDRVEELADMVDELYERALEGELRLASEQSMIMHRALGRLDA